MTKWRRSRLLSTGEEAGIHRATDDNVALISEEVTRAVHYEVCYWVYPPADRSHPPPRPTEVYFNTDTGARFRIDIDESADPKAADAYSYAGWLPLVLVAYPGRPGPAQAVYLGDDWTTVPTHRPRAPKAGWQPSGLSADCCLAEIRARSGLRIFKDEPPGDWPPPAEVRRNCTTTAMASISSLASEVQIDTLNGPPDGPERAAWTHRTNRSRRQLLQTITATLSSSLIDWKIEP